jgi:hypothetical protein
MKLFFVLARLTSYGLILLKLLLDAAGKRFDRKDYGIICITGALLLVTARCTGKKDYLIYWAFIVAGHDIEYKKIIKYALITRVLSMMIIFAGCGLHIIPNVRNIRGDGTVRYGLGFFYGGLLAHFFMYVILMWIYVRQESLTIAEIIGLTCGNVLLYIATDTKNPFALGFLALGGALILKQKKQWKKLPKGSSFAAALMPPVAAGTIIALSYCYDDSIIWMSKFNRLLNGRLRLGKDGIQEFGTRLFGQNIAWDFGTKYYNIVDSSFLKMLLEEGWVFFLLLILAFMLLEIKAARKNDIYLIWVLLIVLIHSMFDDQLLWFGCNAFMMCYSYIKETPLFQKNGC